MHNHMIEIGKKNNRISGVGNGNRVSFWWLKRKRLRRVYIFIYVLAFEGSWWRGKKAKEGDIAKNIKGPRQRICVNLS